VLPARSGGWSIFGHIPGSPPDPAAGVHPSELDANLFNRIDLAERAFFQSRGRAILRLTPDHFRNCPDDDSLKELKAWVANPERNLRISDLRDLLEQAAEAVREHATELAQTLERLGNKKAGLEWEPLPGNAGVVLWNRRRKPSATVLPAMDDGEDETSATARLSPVPLRDHTQHVAAEIDRILARLPLSPWERALQAAAQRHDWGKADDRFQAMLVDDLPGLWAKSPRLPMTAAQREAVRRRADLPRGFRHEMLSMQLAAAEDSSTVNADDRDLILHLIASHHGYARPFAPVVIDEAPPDVSLEPMAVDLTLTADVRAAVPPHRLDSGIPERFWKLNRELGWWGLAYLEAVLRLADQRASAKEDQTPDPQPAAVDTEAVEEAAV
jgi:CRISPR-associated endonuclease/helicase Cas3